MTNAGYGVVANYVVDAVNHLNDPISTSTVLASSVNPSTFGSGTKLTATVTPSTATGTITFKDGSTTIGTAPIGRGSGSLTIANLAIGSHSLTAVYGANGNYLASTSSGVTQIVNAAFTTTVLVSSLNPSTFGSGTRLTATVSPSSATGTITFKDGLTTLGTATLGHGSGSLTVSNLSVATHSLTAVYGGNSSYSTSTSNTVSQVVNKATSTTVLVSSLNPSTVGSGVILTATVSPSSATGTLTFKDGSITIGTVTLGHGSGAAHHQCSISRYPLSHGRLRRQRHLPHEYQQHRESGREQSHLHDGPRLQHQPHDLRQRHNAAGHGDALHRHRHDHVQGRRDDDWHGHPRPRFGCALTTSALSVGIHSLTAVYAGNGTYLTSTSNTVTQTVNQAASSTVLVSSANPTTFGSGTTLTATVSPSQRHRHAHLQGRRHDHRHGHSRPRLRLTDGHQPLRCHSFPDGYLRGQLRPIRPPPATP